MNIYHFVVIVPTLVWNFVVPSNEKPEIPYLTRFGPKFIRVIKKVRLSVLRLNLDRPIPTRTVQCSGGSNNTRWSTLVNVYLKGCHGMIERIEPMYGSINLNISLI